MDKLEFAGEDQNLDKYMIIVNPISANGKTGRIWPGIAAELSRQGLNYDFQLTSGSKDATRLAKKALQDGYRTVVAVGGDGTINEVVNGFYDEKDGSLINSDSRLGIIASGTGRDFIKSLGYPAGFKETGKILVRGQCRPIDIGQVKYQGYGKEEESSFFINVAGMGMDGETVHRVNHTSKALGGKISFLGGTIMTLVQYRNRELTLEIDGMVRYHGAATLAVVANGQYIGGGMRIAPQAKLDSGYFDIIIANELGKLEMIANLPRLYRGTHLDHPKVYAMKGTHIRCTSRQKVLLNVDGEQPGILDAEFNMAPHRLQVIC